MNWYKRRSLNSSEYVCLLPLANVRIDQATKVDLYRECPFWEENVYCMNRDCSVYTVDEVRTFLDVSKLIRRASRVRYLSSGELARSVS
jgi:hypothetical protein